MVIYLVIISKGLMMKWLLVLVCLVVVSSAQTLTLGVVPQQSPLKLLKKWTQITSYLSKNTGVNVVFKTESSIPLFEKKLYAGEYDLAYMNPYHFIVAHHKKEYDARIRANKKIVGILLSKDKSMQISKENLKGKTFLYPAPNAFAATLLTKYELKDKFGLDIEKEAKILYVNSHDSVYKGIERNIGDIGGGIIRTFNNYKKSDTQQLYIVYKTSAYPSHPIAFHPRVSEELKEKFIQAFLKMPEDLKKLLSIKEFIQTQNEEYDVIQMFSK